MSVKLRLKKAIELLKWFVRISGLISKDLSYRSYVVNSLSVVTKFNIALKAAEFKTTLRKWLI